MSIAGVDVPPLAASTALPPVGSSLAAFINALNGHTVDSCGGFPAGQCTALACAWCRNLSLGTPCGSCSAPNHCDGYCWAGGAYAGWTWVPYAAGRVPSPGDVVAYHPCSADGIGASGHVDIFVSGNASRFTSFAQNWNGPTSKLVSHGYECVVGWHHPNGGGPPPPTCSPPCTFPAFCNSQLVCETDLFTTGGSIVLLLAAGGLALLALRPDVRADLEAREQELQHRVFGGGVQVRTRRAVNPLRRPASRAGAGFR